MNIATRLHCLGAVWLLQGEIRPKQKRALGRARLLTNPTFL
ncbi:Uncharacterised protein [Burkholderia pseudomallei]|nr:Uncharacterised protein [Burkholderia pseudomallei]CAJ9219426.1 Uncharacterised protein [Burkholderia pseudomallei]